MFGFKGSMYLAAQKHPKIVDNDFRKSLQLAEILIKNIQKNQGNKIQILQPHFEVRWHNANFKFYFVSGDASQ